LKIKKLLAGANYKNIFLVEKEKMFYEILSKPKT